MSDLMLNTFTAPIENKKPVIKEKLEELTKKNQKNSVHNKNNNFSFNFTGNAKVKAVVAKRRPVKPHIEAKAPEKTTDGDKYKKKSDQLLKSEAKPINAPTKAVNGHNKEEVEFPDHVPGQFVMNPKKRKVSDTQKPHDLKKKKPNTKPINTKPNPSAPAKPSAESTVIEDEEFVEPTPPSNRKLESASDLNEFKFFEKQKKPLITQTVTNPIIEDVFSGCSFESSGIHPHSAKNIRDLLGYKELTSVQHKTIPVVLAGDDVLVKSQTGSGKTLAYALPMVEALHQIRPKSSRKDGILALVIVPTRELAVQTYELFLKLLKPFTWLVAGYLCGGEKRKSEKARLRNGINILVVTPGRMCDHLVHTESMRLDKVKFLVLDEADRLLELGYETDVRKIVDSLNSHQNGKVKKDDSAFESEEETPVVKKSVQSLLLSATLTPLVKKLAGLTLKDPKFVETTINENANLASLMGDDNEQEIENISIPTCVTQRYLICPVKMRLVTLSGLIAHECGFKKHKILVFFATQDMVDYHYDVMVEILALKADGSDDEDEKETREIDEDIDIEEYETKQQHQSKVTEDGICADVRFFKLHGSMSQVERNTIFYEFRATKTGVLFCTDVAGRGVDFPEIDMVVQYTPPQKLFDYVHRVGRTGRAGRNGTAVTFLTPYEQEFVNHLVKNRIQITADSVDFYLRRLLPANNKRDKLQDVIYQLQNKYENLLKGDKEIHERGCKAFMSWIRFYSTFPKNMRQFFSLKQAHMGHYAKSLGLQEPPSQCAKKHSAPKDARPVNRLTSKDQRVSKWKRDKEPNKWGEGGKSQWDDFNIGSLSQAAKNSIALNILEFGSGMPDKKPSGKKSRV